MSAATTASESGPGAGGDPGGGAAGASDTAHAAAWGDAWSVPSDVPAGASGEASDGRGGVRPHWRGVLDALDRLGPAALAERAGRLERAAAGLVTPPSPGADGPAWRLDPVPLPLPAPEFAALEAGLIQRARLLDAVLADVYGPQTVLADGTLPPALVFANPGFLRACRTDPAPGDPLLRSLAFDLVRGPDRAWRVLAELTGGAPGAGYAREGRRLLARVLPEPFRVVRPRRLGPFFAAWREALRGAAPGPCPTPGPDDPAGVALLAPGPGGPHRADDVLLSRALGCPPVHGRDLVVRGGGVFLRSSAAERPVRVLLRRVEGARVDPLELVPDGAAPDGAAGVAGLLGAARAGAVRVVNGPGAGLVEAPAFAAFWPALCRRLLGEALRLPGLPTLWLADAEARERLGRQPARWRIRPALDPAAPPPPASGAAGRAALDADLAARPWGFVAVGEVSPSVAPAWDLDAGGPTTRPVVVRVFLVHDGRGWRVMPGGMARLAGPGAAARRGPPGRLVAKDVWVLDPAAGPA